MSERVLKSVSTTYEYALAGIKTLIANDLRVHPDRVEVKYVIQEVNGDPLDRFPGTREVTKVRVTVKG